MSVSLDSQRLHAAYAEGLTPEAVVTEVFARIEAASDPGIFISLASRDVTLAAARALPPFDPTRYPLWGLPCAIKDNIDVTGFATTAACPTFTYQPHANATAVGKLIDAGALVIGKTNLDQFATGLVGVRTPHPIPRNAFDAKRVPGGSSSGSAVAVARGLVSFSLGTDTAGSGRVPAALNNIVGLKPSLGVISTAGVVPACRTLDCISVFALCVDDAWTIYRAIAGFDAGDPYSAPLDIGEITALPPALTLGVPREQDLLFGDDRDVAQAWRASLEGLAAMGARFVPIDMQPFFETARLLYEGPWVAERYAAIQGFLKSNGEAVLPVTRAIIERATDFCAADLFEAQYRLAALRRKTEPLWRSLDAMLVPSTPSFPTLAELEADPLGPNARLGSYTNFVNLLDLAALAVPGPFRPDGLPAGVTLIGPRASDARLAAIGRAFHAQAGVEMGATGEPLPRSADIASARDDCIEIVVVGAHLSGMPLNHELVAAGGIFLRAGATEPCYRLHALAGEGPAKPGLLRVASGEGRAIETEVWALPPDAFGRFVASIPPPLGIGTLRLADGSRPKGFLVEPAGLRDAPDISHHGGWRTYALSKAASAAE